MAKGAGVVEINGSRYDSATGNIIGGVIDGFVRQKRPGGTKAVSKKPVKPVAVAAKKTAKPARAVRPSSRVHHRTERSKTLMRTMVMRPTLRVKETVSAISKTHPADKDRSSRSSLIKKSVHVSRFGAIDKSDAKPSKPEVIKKTAEVRPLESQAVATQAAPLSTASHQRLERILDEALASADAHKQALKRRSTRLWRPFGLPRWATIIIATLITLLIASLLIWLSVPAVAVKAAAWRAHVSAELPAYVPAGYSFNKVESTPGVVTIQYHDRASGTSQYSLSQSKTSWDSQTLQANTISKTSSVQTSQVGGTTVYIYGSSNDARWVSSGHLYTLSNHAKLNSDQILHIAGSL